jgi:3-phosphoglycerate kinase
MRMRFIEDLDVKGKTVFLRVDFNVPLNDDGTIRSDKRVKASLPAITFCWAGAPSSSWPRTWAVPRASPIRP